MKPALRRRLAMLAAVAVAAGLVALFLQRDCRYYSASGTCFARAVAWRDGVELAVSQRERGDGNDSDVASLLAGAQEGVTAPSPYNDATYAQCGGPREERQMLWFAEIRDTAFAASLVGKDIVTSPIVGPVFVRSGFEAAAAERFGGRYGQLPWAHLDDPVEHARSHYFRLLAPPWFREDAWRRDRLVGWYRGGMLLQGHEPGRYYWFRRAR